MTLYTSNYSISFAGNPNGTKVHGLWASVSGDDPNLNGQTLAFILAPPPMEVWQGIGQAGPGPFPPPYEFSPFTTVGTGAFCFVPFDGLPGSSITVNATILKVIPSFTEEGWPHPADDYGTPVGGMGQGGASVGGMNGIVNVLGALCLWDYLGTGGVPVFCAPGGSLDGSTNIGIRIEINGAGITTSHILVDGASVASMLYRPTGAGVGVAGVSGFLEAEPFGVSDINITVIRDSDFAEEQLWPGVALRNQVGAITWHKINFDPFLSP